MTLNRLFLFLLLDVAVGLEQSFLREPSDQIATVGEHVTLPCRVINKQGVLQWTRDDFGLGSERDLDGFNSYQMTGSDEEGDFTLDIDPVSLEDDARFQCQVGAVDGVAPIRSRYATLTVLVPPDPPKILPMGNQYKSVEGKIVELRCESNGGKPASEITWFDSDNSVVTTGIDTIQELLPDGKRFKTISTLRFVAKKEHNGKSFTCQAQNSADRQPLSDSIRLEVHYPPHVTLTSNKANLLEGDRVKFMCHGEANPNVDLRYTWYVGDRRVAQNNNDRLGFDSELILESVDRSWNGQEIRCEVANPTGKSMKTVALNVSYSPAFITRPSSVSATHGDRVTLQCKVNSNPKPTYVWYHALRPDHVVSYSSNFTFIANEVTSGEYVCRASAEGYADVSASANVFLKAKPFIKRENAIQHSAESTDGFVICQAISVPEPELVEWAYKGKIIDNRMGEKYVVRNVIVEDGIRSTLIVKDVNHKDFGAYKCTVANALGSDARIIQLRKKNSMPIMIVIAGVFGGILLTVAIIMIMILCRRNCSKKLIDPEISQKDTMITIKPKVMPEGNKSVEKTNSTSSTSSSSSTTSSSTSGTSADGLSNNSSSELKVDVRTSSSMSAAVANGESWKGDFVDGLPRPFEHQSYNTYSGQSTYYTQNLLTATNQTYGNYSHTPDYTTTNQGPSYKDLYTQQDPNGRYSVHVRSSPISPSHNGGAISVKGYNNNINSSFDYVPASVFCRDSSPNLSRYDNYSTYSQHEVVVPPPSYTSSATTRQTKVSSVSSCSNNSSAGSGSLATHV